MSDTSKIRFNDKVIHMQTPQITLDRMQELRTWLELQPWTILECMGAAAYYVQEVASEHIEKEIPPVEEEEHFKLLLAHRDKLVNHLRTLPVNDKTICADHLWICANLTSSVIESVRWLFLHGEPENEPKNQPKNEETRDV